MIHDSYRYGDGHLFTHSLCWNTGIVLCDIHSIVETQRPNIAGTFQQFGKIFVDTKIKQLYWFLSLLCMYFFWLYFKPACVVIRLWLARIENGAKKTATPKFYMCQLFGGTHKFSASINGIRSNRGIFMAQQQCKRLWLLVGFFPSYTLSFASAFR